MHTVRRASTPLISSALCLFAAGAFAAPPPAPLPPTPPAAEAQAAAAPTADAPPVVSPPAPAGPPPPLPASTNSAPPPAPPADATGKGTNAAAPVAPHAAPPTDEGPDCEREHDRTEGAGSFLLGPALLNLSSLNDRLQANGYEKLESVATFIGGEGHAIFGNGFVAGARGGAIFGPSGAGPDDMRAHLNGGFGLLDFGYAFVHTERFLFTFTGGIGGYGMDLSIGNGQSVRFDDVLRDPRHSASMSQGGVLVGLTLGIDWRIPTGHMERGRRGFFTMGARIGGLYGPPIGGWGIANGGDATDGPNTGLTGGFAALAIGFGGGGLHAAEAKK
jgi:hypothetical protein